MLYETLSKYSPHGGGQNVTMDLHGEIGNLQVHTSILSDPTTLMHSFNNSDCRTFVVVVGMGFQLSQSVCKLCPKEF